GGGGRAEGEGGEGEGAFGGPGGVDRRTVIGVTPGDGVAVLAPGGTPGGVAPAGQAAKGGRVRRFPDVGLAIVAPRGCRQPAVGGECAVDDRVVVCREAHLFLAAGKIEQGTGELLSHPPREEQLAGIRRGAGGRYHTGQLVESLPEGAAGIPQADGLVIAAGGQRLAVRAPGHTPHFRLVAAQDGFPLAGGDRPESCRAVVGGGGEPAPVRGEGDTVNVVG